MNWRRVYFTLLIQNSWSFSAGMRKDELQWGEKAHNNGFVVSREGKGSLGLYSNSCFSEINWVLVLIVSRRFFGKKREESGDSCSQRGFETGNVLEVFGEFLFVASGKTEKTLIHFLLILTEYYLGHGSSWNSSSIVPLNEKSAESESSKLSSGSRYLVEHRRETLKNGCHKDRIYEWNSIQKQQFLGFESSAKAIIDMFARREKPKCSKTKILDKSEKSSELLEKILRESEEEKVCLWVPGDEFQSER